MVHVYHVFLGFGLLFGHMPYPSGCCCGDVSGFFLVDFKGFAVSIAFPASKW